jgi:hypothetical protein
MASTETRPGALVGEDPRAGKYLARATAWEWHNNGQIDVLNGAGDVAATLSEWQTTVFHAADGNTSVQEFVSSMADAYVVRDQPVPDDLSAKLVGEVTHLIDDLNCVELWEKKGDLRVDYEFPQSELPIED